LAVAWGRNDLASRAVAETDGEGFEELSMVVGLLAWLAWDVETDIAAASQRGDLQGPESEQWYKVQLLAALGRWLVPDDNAATILDESVARTPRFHVDGERWLAVHRSALETFAAVEAAPDTQGKTRRRAKPGDLVVLHGGESPRVRVVLDVQASGDNTKVVVLDPAGTNGKRIFLASRVATLPWVVPASTIAASA
jgi:hypothetical protein